MQSTFSVYRWILSFLKPYALLFAGLITIMVTISSVQLAIPKMIQYFIDVILPAQDWSMFTLLFVGLIVFVILMIAFMMISNWLQRHIQEKASRDLQVAIFSHIRKLGFSYYEKNPVGQTLAFLNTEVSAVQNLYRHLFPMTVFSFIFTVIALIMMVTSSWQLTIVVVPFFVLYYLYGPAIEQKAAKASRLLAIARIAANQKAHESVSAIQELRLFSAEDWDLQRYLDKVDTWNEKVVRSFFLSFLRGSGRTFSFYAGAIGLFVIGVWLLERDLITSGELVGFLLLYFVAMQELTRLVSLLTEQFVLMHQTERLYWFVQKDPDVKEPKDHIKLEQPIKGDIHFANVHFAYQPEKPVLRGFNLTIKAGEKVAIVGESGNGKSTIIKLLGRFYDPGLGEITLDGIPIKQLSFASLRNPLGFVFQETFLFGHTISENILFGRPEATEEEVISAAKAAYAHDFIMQMPDGYDTYVGERGVKLSGGQRQRIAIARMFIKNPTVILLDEATSALDDVSEREVQLALDQLMEGRTVIAVAHRLQTIKHFDQIVVLEDGQKVEQGTYEQLSQAGGVFQRLLTGETSQTEVHME